MRGFSLVEVAIVIGMLAFVSAVGVVMGLGSYRNTQFNTDRDTFRIALTRARLEALSGVCAGGACIDPIARGVAVTSSGYVIFEGAAYALRHADEDELLESVHSDQKSAGTEIVFEPLSADVLVPVSVVFKSSAGHVSTTSVNSEGAITETP